MRKSAVKFALVICMFSIFLVVVGLLFSINISNKYSRELSTFNTGGQKLSETTKSYTFSRSSNNPQVNPLNKQEDAFAVYTYQNIDFVSFSEQWDEQKLETLALELFKNVHGDEIAYVARVELHGSESDQYAGLHRSSYEKNSIPISVNNLLPNDMTLDFSALSSVIVLAGADENTTVESMARTLSHEYGHHFTQYYFGFTGTAADMMTKYASIRKENGAPIYSVITNWDYYLANHMWDLQEIAAEDYVFFMGSPLATQEVDYLDNSELAKLYSKSEKLYNDFISQPMDAVNSFPHENPVLSSPSQVEGLAEYYYSFVSDEPPIYTSISENYSTMSMNLSQTSTGSYTMTWISPWPYNNISYTLVAYDANDYMLKPIKTVAGDEPSAANFGTQKNVKGQSEYIIDDTLDELGFVRFRIVVTFFDGSVIFSDPLDVQF